MWSKSINSISPLSILLLCLLDFDSLISGIGWYVGGFDGDDEQLFDSSNEPLISLLPPLPFDKDLETGTIEESCFQEITITTLILVWKISFLQLLFQKIYFLMILVEIQIILL